MFDCNACCIQTPCPRCGYCPCCGRGGQQFVPYQPYYPPYGPIWVTTPSYTGGYVSPSYTGGTNFEVTC